MTRPARMGWFAGSLALTAVLLAAWQYVSDNRIVSPVFLPSPQRAWNALVAGVASGSLTGDTLETVRRMIYGWLLASLAGVALGAVIGMSRAAMAYLGPTLEFLRPLPASAVMPIAIAFFGLSDGMVLGVVGFGTMWPVLLATLHGISSTEPRLLEVSRVLGLSRLQTFAKIFLPNAMIDIFAGMRLGLTVALILSVVGEMLSGQHGLGQRVLLAARAFRAPELFAGVMVLGLLGFASNTLLSVASNHVLRWNRA